MEAQQRPELFTQFPTEENMSQSTVHTSTNPVEDPSRGSSQDQRLTIENWELQQLGEFQDSRLSPALSLLPSNSGVQHNFTEYSLFQQTDLEFAPLRPSPDVSVASERFHLPPQERTSRASEHGSLSQHPLAHATGLSEHGSSSCCSLSQHSMSPGDEGGGGGHAGAAANERGSRRARDAAAGSEERDDGQTPTAAGAPYQPLASGAEDDASFLSGDVPARQLLALLQKDVGMASGSSSSVVSSSETSETSLKRADESFTGTLKTAGVSRPDAGQSAGTREALPGGPPPTTPSSPRDARRPKGKPRQRVSEISNITVRSRSAGAEDDDDSSDALRRELLSEIERSRSCEAGAKARWPGGDAALESVTPAGTYAGKHESVTQSVLADAFFGTGPPVERGQWEREPWSSGNQTGMEGSFLGYLPQSHSTPGVLDAPRRSRAPLGRLSAIESHAETSGSGSRTSARSPIAMVDSDATAQPRREAASEKVQALPSLNYMQKVDAWRANQSSGKSSLFDGLAPHGLSGVASPGQRACDAASESLRRALGQRAQDGPPQPPFSTATTALQGLTPGCSGHSTPQRGEAVGSAPNDSTTTASAPSASQSRSSLAMVIASFQQTPRAVEHESGLAKERGPPPPPSFSPPPPPPVQPSPLLASLGRFSDVSFHRDAGGAHSPNSYGSGLNPGASVGGASSSVVSLEVDNYAPYWSSKTSELNIEERIPLYLLNLGIDQSPSTILTPFAPRGPIREPEFSPTDLGTTKGSIGTPTRSAQLSEGGSPGKGEFSRCSLLSVDSSVSLPLSVDSLYPGLPFPEPAGAFSPPSSEGSVGGLRMAAISTRPRDIASLQPDHNVARRGVESGGPSLPGNPGGESRSQSSHSAEQSDGDSFVGAKTLRDIRELLGQAGNTVSGRTSSSASSSGGSHLHSDEDALLLSLRRRAGVSFQDASFASSSAARSSSSPLWARSSSDSLLTLSERPRESSLGGESLGSPGRAAYRSTQALSGVSAPPPPPAADTNTAAGSSSLLLLLTKTARRAEPEGCSAAPPDNTATPPDNTATPPDNTATPPDNTATPPDNTATPPLQQPTLPDPEPRPSGPREATGETASSTSGGVAESSSSSPSSSSPAPLGDPGQQGALSDSSSSESSLAARVAKLLQEESPSTVTSSRASTADQEEGRAREWIKLTVSGLRVEPLELDLEDRRRIEEIKRELLLAHPLKSQTSTDTDSSAVSSSRSGPQGPQPLPQPAGPSTAPRALEGRLSHQPHSLPQPAHPRAVRDRLSHQPQPLPQPAHPRAVGDRLSHQLHPHPQTAGPSTAPRPLEDRLSHQPQPLPQPAHPRAMEDPLFRQPQPPTTTPLDRSTPQPCWPPPQDLEARVQEIAVREGVTLPRAKHLDRLTSITIATCRRSASPSPSPSPSPAPPPPPSLSPAPEPLRLDQLSAAGGEEEEGEEDCSTSSTQESARDAAVSTSEPGSRPNAGERGEGRRRDALGGDRDQPGPPSRTREREDVKVGDDDDDTRAPSRRRRDPRDVGAAFGEDDRGVPDEPPSPGRHDAGQGADGTGQGADGTAHVSQLHLTLTPKATAEASGGPPSREFAPLRPSSSATSSPDEGIVLSSPAGSHRARVAPERTDASTAFGSAAPRGELSWRTQSFFSPQRPLAVQTPAVPVLLPYKPHGSEELFYVPECQASPTRSDSTMESSHPGSDDAVPPCFSSEVLGSREDAGLARGVTIKHAEGIYSKRLKATARAMQTPARRGSTTSVDGSSQTSRAPQPSSRSSGVFVTGVAPPIAMGPQGPQGSKRDQGTSPVQFLSHERVEESQGSGRTRSVQRSGERERARNGSRHSCSALEQLWHLYSARWRLEEDHPTNEREAALLLQLERLSRHLHGEGEGEGEGGQEGEGWRHNPPTPRSESPEGGGGRTTCRRGENGRRT